MALNDDIYNRVSEIYAQMGETVEANAQIAREAQAAGLSPSQLSSALNVPETEISRLASEAGVPFTPPASTASISSPDFSNLSGLANYDTSGLGSYTPPASTSNNNNNVTIGSGGQNVTLDTSGTGTVGPTLGTNIPTIDVDSTADSGVRVSTPEETAGVTIDTSTPAPDGFNAEEYLALYPDVAQAGVDPLEHYLNYGKSEGRSPNQASFETDQLVAIEEFKAALPENMQADYQFIVDNPERFIANGQADVQAIADYLKDKGFSFEEAMQLTGLTPDNPVFAEAQTAYGVSDEDIAETTSEEEAIAQFKAALPENMQADYQFIIDNPERFTTNGQPNVQAIADYLKDKGFSFEEAMQLTGLTADNPLFAEAQAAYGVSDEDVESMIEDGSLSSGGGPTESFLGRIVPSAPQVGEVNILDYLSLQAGKPTLPMGTKLSTQIEEIDAEATGTLLGDVSESAGTKIATGTQYVAEPAGITAKQVESPTAKDAVTGIAQTTDLVGQPEVATTTAVKSLEQITQASDALQAARQDLNEIDPRATVQGQLALLQEQFAEGETPVWAQGAMRQATALMAQRGIGSSTIAAEAITNALMQSTLPIAQQDASFYQNVTIQNLSNEQQVRMERFNAQVNAIFNDQAAENTARNLNMQSENQMAQFFTELSQNVALANTAQVNAMEQFNATAENQMTQFFEELGLTADTFNAEQINEMAQFDAEQLRIVRQLNAELDNQREMFNVNNQLNIDANNVQWRRDVNTANTAATNAALQFDATSLLGIQQTALNNIWQHFDTILNYAFQAEQNEKDRAFQIMLTTMTADMKAAMQADSDLMDLFGIAIGGAARIAASDSATDWLFGEDGLLSFG